jgi:hypothetical protein
MRELRSRFLEYPRQSDSASSYEAVEETELKLEPSLWRFVGKVVALPSDLRRAESVAMLSCCFVCSCITLHDLSEPVHQAGDKQ